MALVNLLVFAASTTPRNELTFCRDAVTLCSIVQHCKIRLPLGQLHGRSSPHLRKRDRPNPVPQS